MKNGLSLIHMPGISKAESGNLNPFGEANHKLEEEPLTLPYKKIHVVINPAAGQDEPVLNVLNRIFSYGGG